MQLDISDEQINGIVKQSINQEVKRRIENSVNDGIADWFSQQNLMSVTRAMIEELYVPQITEKFMSGLHIDPDRIADIIGESVASYFRDQFCG